MMKRLGYFYLINNKVEYEEFEKSLDGKFGVQNPTIRNKPTKFPVLLSYCFTSDVNGHSVNLKHSQLDDLKSFIND
jgi:hypothetical protein